MTPSAIPPESPLPTPEDNQSISARESVEPPYADQSHEPAEGVDPWLADTNREPLYTTPSSAPPRYYFDYSLSDNNLPALQAVKAWTVAGEPQREAVTLAEYGTFEATSVVERELNELYDEHGLETAMNLAELMAETNGYLDADRDDPRLFTSGPPDPFTTGRERALATDDLDWDYLPDPDYDFELYERDDETLELQAVKRWEADDMGYLEREAQIIENFAPHEREQAEVKQDVLRLLRESAGLEASMQAAETLAGVHGHLDPERDDPRLFTDGPPDPFTTLRGLEMDTDLEPEPSSPDPSAPWRFDVRSAETPDGEPLGVALTMTVFPDAADGQIPDDESVTRVQQLEVAHLTDEQAAQAFEEEFRTYLTPGLLEGPELAETIAELEGLPGQWVETTGENIVGLTNGEKTTLVRQPEDWHPYNPDAEQEARIAAEGDHIDPLHQFTTFDEDKNDPKVEPTAPDFNL